VQCKPTAQQQGRWWWQQQQQGVEWLGLTGGPLLLLGLIR
jgi:hypothetical protein